MAANPSNGVTIVAMGDGTARISEIERLRKRFEDAAARRTALLREADDFAARLGDIRAAFGNPYFYSRPADTGESVANYTGASSHKVVLPTVLALRRVERELGQIKERLRELGVSAD
jgi:hypothetical protein